MSLFCRGDYRQDPSRSGSEPEAAMSKVFGGVETGYRPAILIRLQARFESAECDHQAEPRKALYFQHTDGGWDGGKKARAITHDGLRAVGTNTRQRGRY